MQTVLATQKNDSDLIIKLVKQLFHIYPQREPQRYSHKRLSTVFESTPWHPTPRVVPAPRVALPCPQAAHSTGPSRAGRGKGKRMRAEQANVGQPRALAFRPKRGAACSGARMVPGGTGRSDAHVAHLGIGWQPARGAHSALGTFSGGLLLLTKI